MATFPNAAPPPGALFDNAPTVTPPCAPCRDYTDGVTAVWASGRTQQGRCRTDKVQDVDTAVDALRHGAAQVFVAREDAKAVLEAVRGTDGDNAHG